MPFDRGGVAAWWLLDASGSATKCGKEGLLIRARVTSYSYSAKLEVGILSFHSLFLGGFEPRSPRIERSLVVGNALEVKCRTLIPCIVPCRGTNISVYRLRNFFGLLYSRPLSQRPRRSVLSSIRPLFIMSPRGAKHRHLQMTIYKHKVSVAGFIEA